MSKAQEIAPVLSEGIDRKALKKLKDRFLEVNNGRLQRMILSLSGRHKSFLECLPVLLHLNHPSLPGYTSARTPCGIQGYQPDKQALHATQLLARSFHYRKNPHAQHDILAVYLMGSTGTVAHSDQSDMDFWVCHRPGLTDAACNELRNKLDQISAWADQMGLEAHFFIMDPIKFKQGERGNVSGEDCGSAQHYLLLDEFYRTSLIVAGCLPLWWMVPEEEEKNYEAYSRTLLDKRFIPAQDYIDFGGIHQLPAGEFIGAGMWQLYKGIDSPYKSVLKIVITEIYASEYPRIETLSTRYKRTIYRGHLELDELDPYIMVYRKIEEYLQARGEIRRLELIRHCLYFKVDEKLTRETNVRHKSWRRELMTRLTAEWGWDTPYLKQLDNRSRWKVNRVRQERQELVQELNYSYRFLSNFARQNQIEASINQDDMNLLGRKLYAAFERKGGKIELINPGITQDISEDHLSFHFKRDQDHPGINDYWAVYRDYLKARDLRSHEPIKKARSIIELIAWCYFNRLIDTATRYSVDVDKNATDLNDAELHQIVSAFGHLFPDRVPSVPQANFQQPAYPSRICLFVNVGIDPMSELTSKGIYRLSNHTDALNFSALRYNLVLSLDQITLNSWGEIICSHHHSDSALIDCLVSYLRQVPPSQRLPSPHIDIRCYSRQRGKAIASRVEQLFRDVIACYYASPRGTQTRFLLEIEQYIYVLQFKQDVPVVRAVRDYAQLYDLLADTQPIYSALVIDQYCLEKHPLRVVTQMGTSGSIQVFYHQDGHHAELFIHDEMGSVFHTRKPWHDEQSLLVPLHHFFQAIALRRNTALHDHNHQPVLIHYYEIIGTPGKTELHAERRRIRESERSLRFFNVQAIGEQTWTDDFFYTIYCGNTEFSQFEFGDDLFPAVARHIASIRQHNATYPCYLTDLDLTQVTNEKATAMQTVEFLRFKDMLEAQINRELTALATVTTPDNGDSGAP